MIRKILPLILLVCTCTTMRAFEPVEPDTTKGLIDKGKIQIALQTARVKYLNGETRPAMLLYKNVLVDDPKNATAHFYVAQCQYDLKYFPSAKESLDEAKKYDPKVNKELDYLYGRVYHRLNELDKAIEHYEKFKATLEGNVNKDNEYRVSDFIAQAKAAKQRMANPIPAEVSNFGKVINTRYPEYWPVMAPDGQTMYFTSRRPDTEGGNRYEGDNKFYEDTYQSIWNAETNTWSDPEGIIGRVNSEGWDAATSMSADGEYMYLTQNILGYTKSSDISMTKMSSSGKWGNPKPLGKNINTSYFESSATLTGDGETMFFISERTEDGLGRGDIYMAKRVSRREWGDPVNLGAVINTSEDENAVYVHPSGKILFFSSTGHDGMGGYDIYKSELVDGNWTKPVNLGYPINTTGDDVHFKISNDGNIGYFASDRDNGYGDSDIYTVDLTKYPVLKPGMIFRTHGYITGNVLNEDGQRVPARIEIYNKKNGRKIDAVATDDQGSYEIKLPGNMEYELRVMADGYSMAREEVELTLDEREETRVAKDVIVKK